jgi:hypothetical protein
MSKFETAPFLSQVPLAFNGVPKGKGFYRGFNKSPLSTLLHKTAFFYRIT